MTLSILHGLIAVGIVALPLLAERHYRGPFKETICVFCIYSAFLIGAMV